MAINVSVFHKSNVVDSCSLWNLLSSATLYRAALSNACSFCCTTYVEYECLHKPRTKESHADNRIRKRLVEECHSGKVQVHSLEIADLQEVEVLRSRKCLSMGELSSMAFARKTNQAFLTDDQKARKLAATILESSRVQTTPHLLGWLCFVGALGGEHMPEILCDHENHDRPLKPYFESAFCEALRCRTLMARDPEK